MEKLYKTGEVLKASGVSREVFYRYLTMGLVKAAKISPGGHNLFAESVFTQLELIQSLNASGYTLRDIKDIYFRDERLDGVVGERPADDKSR